MRTTGLLIAGLLLTPLAVQAESYDLRKLALDADKKKVGFGVLEEIEETNADSGVKQGYKAMRTVIVVAVDEQSEPTQEKWIYHSFELTGESAQKVHSGKNLEFMVTKTPDGWRPKAVAGCPKALWQHIETLAQKKSGDDGTPTEEKVKIFPATPIEVGAKWEIPKEVVFKMIGMPPSVPGIKSVTGEGKLRGTKKLGPSTLLDINMRIEIVFTTYRGLPCPTPIVMAFEMNALIATDHSPRGEERISFSSKGVATTPEGDRTLDMGFSKKTHRSPPK